ncbi:MAG: DUF4124 domain-containing protein [Thiotrichaceae bacterium]|nr:DUF4124 domain-containing protein [Thiotrichaceae bacterium]
MKSVQPLVAILATTLFSGSILAGAYKCTDEEGNISYQSAPCAKENTAAEINMKTGGLTDLSIEQKKNELAQEIQNQQAAEQLKIQEQIAKRKYEAMTQSALNQQLIKDHPQQFSAFAIPPYISDKLPTLVKQYESRLPEIEKFRRLAAQKALASGECLRVESDQLSSKSTTKQLVFSIDCSSAKSFHFNETELSK